MELVICPVSDVAGKSPSPLRLVIHVIGCRGSLRPCRAVTHQAPATTRRRRPQLSTSSGHGDTARHDPHAHRLRARSSPAQRSASRCRSGGGRWAIRWAKPSGIGPNQAQRWAHMVATCLADLQAFRGLRAQRTPCFTRERSPVRSQPRPSSSDKVPSGAGTDTERGSDGVAAASPRMQERREGRSRAGGGSDLVRSGRLVAVTDTLAARETSIAAGGA
jgi:hypothetical protein